MIKLNRSCWKERKMKPFVKELVWELCIQISVGFLIFGGTCLFIGIVSCLCDGYEVPLGCSLLACIASVIGFVFTVTAVFLCNRTRTWQRLVTNIDLMMNIALIAKSVYLLLI